MSENDDEANVARVRDDALRRALNTPPHPHSETRKRLQPGRVDQKAPASTTGRSGGDAKF